MNLPLLTQQSLRSTQSPDAIIDSHLNTPTYKDQELVPPC